MASEEGLDDAHPHTEGDECKGEGDPQDLLPGIPYVVADEDRVPHGGHHDQHRQDRVDELPVGVAQSQS